MNKTEKLRVLQRVKARVETNWANGYWFATKKQAQEGALEPAKQTTPSIEVCSIYPVETPATECIPKWVEENPQQCFTCLEGAIYLETAQAGGTLGDVEELMAEVEANLPSFYRGQGHEYSGMIPSFNDDSDGPERIVDVLEQTIERVKKERS